MLLLLLACTPDRPDPWRDVPLHKGERPAWGPDFQLTETISQRGDGRRYAARVAWPKLSDDASQVDVTTEGGVWTARYVPDEGPVRTWKITLFGNPDRLPGVPIVLAPNKAEVVANPGPADVTGVLDVGGVGYGFSCLGAGADLEPTGWCLDFLSKVWVERWEG